MRDWFTWTWTLHSTFSQFFGAKSYALYLSRHLKTKNMFHVARSEMDWIFSIAHIAHDSPLHFVQNGGIHSFRYSSSRGCGNCGTPIFFPIHAPPCAQDSGALTDHPTFWHTPSPLLGMNRTGVVTWATSVHYRQYPLALGNPHPPGLLRPTAERFNLHTFLLAQSLC